MRRKRVFSLITLLCFALAVVAAGKRFTLVIDAGHGGGDNGAPGAYSNEKDLTLKYALAFGRYVERNCPDVKVIYTRTTDIFVTLAGRADIANRNKADLFLSFHINAITGSKSARGFQSWTLGRGAQSGDRGIKANVDVAKRENSVMFLEKDYKKVYKDLDANAAENDIMYEFIADKNRERSVELSRLMQQYVCAATGRVNGGSHQNNLAVLRLTSMPSCLLELGFISTPDEEDFLNADSSVPLYVQGVFNAFMKYREHYDSNISVPYKPIKDEPVIPQVVPPSYQNEAPAPKPARKKKVAVAAPEVKAQPDVTPDKDTSAQPVFKVQLFVASQTLRNDDSRLKGLDGVDFYREGALFKYTCGASSDYNEICKLRKQLLERFPDAFIVAFVAGQKCNVNEAIRAFKAHKNK